MFSRFIRSQEFVALSKAVPDQLAVYGVLDLIVWWSYVSSQHRLSRVERRSLLLSNVCEL